MQELISNKKKVVVLGVLIILVCGCKMYFKTTTDQFSATKNADSFENGRNLVFNVCGNCHYDYHIDKFIGKRLYDLPRIAGKLYSANLTNSKIHGLPPHYNDAELFYLLKTGISRNGYFMPYMMRPMMADDDINDIIVYLRSNDAPIAATDTTVGKTHINLIGRIGLRYLTEPQAYNKGVPPPDENDAISYGRYLVAVIGCYHCHSRRAKGLNYSQPEKTKKYLVGGMRLKDPEGNRVFSANLTPDKETGIGNFTEEDFIKAVREGVSPSGEKLNTVMPRFPKLTDKQINAIYTYLKSQGPVHHKVRGS
jgi:mono/diheme cytochrome c family protein